MIEYIERSRIEQALAEAERKMQQHELNFLSEAYIEAKAAAEAFRWVLELMKPLHNYYSERTNDLEDLHSIFVTLSQISNRTPEQERVLQETIKKIDEQLNE